MKRPQLSIAGLMGFVVIVALVMATSSWVNVVGYLTVAVLIVATYQARYRRRLAGAWWFGFSLFGWAYYIFGIDAMTSWSQPAQKPGSFVEDFPFRLADLFITHADVMAASLKGKSETFTARSYLARAFHAGLVLLAASVGGMLCLVLRSRSSDESV